MEIKSLKLKVLACALIGVSYGVSAQGVKVFSVPSQYRTIQEAVDAAPSDGAIIRIAPGPYHERVSIQKPDIWLVGTGQQPQDVVISYGDSAKTTGSTFKSGTVTVNADGFEAENLTIANTWWDEHREPADASQAVALQMVSDHAVIDRVRMLSGQDTLYAASRTCKKATDHPCIASRQFFNECFIEGHVDYIFGDAKAVFDHCELHSRQHNTVMITAQSKLFPQEDSGYYLLHSKITGEDPGAKVFFGRPWRDYVNVLFYDTDIRQQLAPAGWEEWGGRLKTATYREYRSHGPGVNAGNRAVPYPPLTDAEEKTLNPTAILADWTEWNPLQEVARLREQITETTFKKDPIGWPLKASNKGEPQRPFNPKLPTIWIVGDSTAAFHADKPEEGEFRSQGWGLYFPKYFDLSKVNVVNAARGGRSSRTYRTEGLWDTVCSHIKRGDIVLIQLGQNDVFAINDETRARGTIPGTGDESQEIDNLFTKKHETVHTYGWYLRQYIRDTKALGAMPIVLSLTPRDQWLPDGHMERGAPNYRVWSMEIAKQEHHTAFVDVSAIIATQCEKFGKDETAKLYHDGEPVHFNTIGARKFTEWTVSGIIASHAGHLSAYLSTKGKNLPPLSQTP